ncbi:hypothetical protein ACFC58_43435, partial [Kitasatospora purpeofusca]
PYRREPPSTCGQDGLPAADLVFRVRADGTVDLDPALDAFLSGCGSRRLTVMGLPVTLDTTVLGHDLILNPGGARQTAGVHQLAQLPRSGYRSARRGRRPAWRPVLVAAVRGKDGVDLREALAQTQTLGEQGLRVDPIVHEGRTNTRPDPAALPETTAREPVTALARTGVHEQADRPPAERALLTAHRPDAGRPRAPPTAADTSLAPHRPGHHRRPRPAARRHAAATTGAPPWTGPGAHESTGGCSPPGPEEAGPKDVRRIGPQSPAAGRQRPANRAQPLRPTAR